MFLTEASHKHNYMPINPQNHPVKTLEPTVSGKNRQWEICNFIHNILLTCNSLTLLHKSKCSRANLLVPSQKVYFWVLFILLRQGLCIGTPSLLLLMAISFGKNFQAMWMPIHRALLSYTDKRQCQVERRRAGKEEPSLTRSLWQKWKNGFYCLVPKWICWEKFSSIPRFCFLYWQHSWAKHSKQTLLPVQVRLNM